MLSKYEIRFILFFESYGKFVEIRIESHAYVISISQIHSKELYSWKSHYTDLELTIHLQYFFRYMTKPISNAE